MPRSGIAESYGSFNPSFLRNPILFSIVVISPCIPSNSTRGSPFLHILSSIYCFSWSVFYVCVSISVFYINSFVSFIIIIFKFSTFNGFFLKK